MLKKLHFLVDRAVLKCCFSRTMNALIGIKSALRARSGWSVGTVFSGLAAVFLASCHSDLPGDVDRVAPYAALGKPSAQAAEAAPSSRIISGSPPAPAQAQADAFAPRPKERPGLATQWGRQMKSPFTHTQFTRAGSKPHGIDMIYYNDAEGLAAMGMNRNKVAAMQQAAGGIVEWGIRGGMGMLTTYKPWGSAHRYVEGRHGGGYSIVVKNACKARVMVVLSVDGLDVLDGKPAAVTRPGYVIEPGQTLEVKGFRTSFDEVAAFKFSTVGASYAQSRHGDTRNVGVIGLAAFLEKGADPWTWMPDEIKRRQDANPFATR